MTKISELDPAVTLDGSEVVPLVQSDGSGNLDTVRGTVDDVASYANAALVAEANTFAQTQTFPSLKVADSGIATDEGGEFRLEHYTDTTPFLGLPATGVRTYAKDQNGVDRLMEAWAVNYDWTLDSQGYPNNGKASGDDGYRYIYGAGRVVYTTTQNLRAGRPVYTPTIVGGAITTAALDTSGNYRTSGYAAGETIDVFAFGPSGSGFVATHTANGSGVLSGNATITNQGSGYSSSQTGIQGEPPTTTQILDAAPTLELNRDQAADATSTLGVLHFGGRSTGSSVVDTYYASLVSQVVNPANGTQTGRLAICTGGPTSVNSGVNPRFYVGSGFWAEGATDQGAGTIAAMTSVTVYSDDATNATGPSLILSRRSASPAASDNLGTIIFAGRDSGAGTDFYGEIKAVIIDPTAASEDGRIDFRTTIAGSAGNRFFIQDGVFTSASGVVDPGAGHMAADIFKAKTAYWVNGASVIGARKSGWGVPTGTLSRAALTAYTAPNISATYVEAEVQALADEIQTISRTLAALINDIHSGGASSPPHALLTL